MPSRASLALLFVLACAGCRRDPPADRPDPGPVEAVASSPASTDPAPLPKRTRALVPAMKGPGRVVLLDMRSETQVRVELATPGGERTPLPDEHAFAVLPFDHGNAVLLRGGGDSLRTLAIADETAVRFDWHVEETPVAVSERAEAVLLSGWDLDLKSSTLQLTDLASGDGAGLPPFEGLCPLLLHGDIAVDGSEAITSCWPCACAAAPAGCSVSLCRLRTDGHVVEEVRGPPGRHMSPAFTRDDRIAFLTDRGDTRMSCRAKPESCRFDLVAVPVRAPSREPTLLRRGALGVSFSPVSGRMAIVVVDDDGDAACAEWPCAPKRLVIAEADGKGEQVITEVEHGSRLPRDAFSLDDGWVAWTEWDERTPRARACRLSDRHCVELGERVVSGWVRDVADATTLDPRQLDGCYAADVEAIRRTNRISAPDDRPELWRLLEGYRVRFSPGRFDVWNDASGRRLFAAHFTAEIQTQPPDVFFVQLDDAPTSAAPIAAAPAAGGMPPPELASSVKYRFRRDEDGRLSIHENVLLDALWGRSPGPLELVPLPCPSDAPSPAKEP